ncbi:hypothetical protein ACWCSH_14875, partial [Streptosporangium sp. NPDC001682]
MSAAPSRTATIGTAPPWRSAIAAPMVSVAGAAPSPSHAPAAPVQRRAGGPARVLRARRAVDLSPGL